MSGTVEDPGATGVPARRRKKEKHKKINIVARIFFFTNKRNCSAINSKHTVCFTLFPGF